MRILKVIARLLDYPSPELFDAAPDLIQVVNEDRYIAVDTKTQLLDFIKQLTSRDIFDAQETYDLLFDRGRSLSLLLFEHVHGESRDRGQAMVDLLEVYRGQGFEVESSQLPDYIPLYLEFLSEQKSDFAQEWLGDICHLLAMLSERLINRKNSYSILFDSLVELSGLSVDREQIIAAVKKEKPDNSAEAIDKEWEDKEIKFDAASTQSSSCSTSSLHPFAGALDTNKPTPIISTDQVPINWHEKNANQVAGL